MKKSNSVEGTKQGKTLRLELQKTLGVPLAVAMGASVVSQEAQARDTENLRSKVTSNQLIEMAKQEKSLEDQMTLSKFFLHAIKYPGFRIEYFNNIEALRKDFKISDADYKEISSLDLKALNTAILSSEMLRDLTKLQPMWADGHSDVHNDNYSDSGNVTPHVDNHNDGYTDRYTDDGMEMLTNEALVSRPMDRLRAMTISQKLTRMFSQ